MLHNSLLLFVILFLFACAPSKKEQVDNAMKDAQYYLTDGKCGKARDILDDVDYQDDNPEYISLYASTYACDAGYTEIGTTFANLGTLNASSLLGSLASFSSSDETSADSDDYENLQMAIKILIQSDSATAPSAANKIDKFGNRFGTDISIQALYLILVQLGKFMAYYGDTNASGLKGGGSGSNVCIAGYPVTGAHAYLSGAPTVSKNGCNSGNDGHPDLRPTVSSAILKRRMCEAITNFNNLFDILGTVALASNSSLGDLSDVETAVSLLFTVAATEEVTSGVTGNPVSVTALQEITSQEACEDFDYEDLQRYFIFVFESNL